MVDNPFSHNSDVEDVFDVQKRRRFPWLLVFGGIGTLVLLAFLMLPLTRNARPAAYRTQCKNNLKQIGLALHNYHDAHGSFPPAYTVDANGNPLHSWRTLILPFVEQATLYNSIDLSKPWNDPVNQQAYETDLQCYRCPSTELQSGYTNYMAITAEGGCFDSETPRSLADIKDGTSYTLIVIEVPAEESTHWMAPVDAGEALARRMQSAHTGGAQGLLADGSVRFLSENLAEETKTALISINDGEMVGEF
ncbi:MAG: DUF1559 domain-containing protein [Fuerstiella sp.]